MENTIFGLGAGTRLGQRLRRWSSLAQAPSLSTEPDRNEPEKTAVSGFRNGIIKLACNRGLLGMVELFYSEERRTLFALNCLHKEG